MAVPFIASAISAGQNGNEHQLLTSPWHGTSAGAVNVSTLITDAVQHSIAAAWRVAASKSSKHTLPDADTVFLAAAIVSSWWCEVFLLGTKLVVPPQGKDGALHYQWGFADVACLLHHSDATATNHPALFKRIQAASSLLHAALSSAAEALVKAAGASKWRRSLKRWHKTCGKAPQHWPAADQEQVDSAMVPGVGDLQKLLCLVHANAHPLADWAQASGSGVQSDSGLAMAPGAALLNHSSHPNAVCVALGAEGRVEVRASRDIAEGEPVRVAYIDTYRPPPARQSALQETFFFKENQHEYTADLMAAYAQRPFGRELLVSLHNGAAVLPEQPTLRNGDPWAAADPAVLANALACPKCLIGAVIPSSALVRDAPVAQLRASVSSKLCSLLTVSSSSGSIKPRSGPNVTQTPPPSDSSVGDARQDGFLPVLSHAASESQGVHLASAAAGSEAVPSSDPGSSSGRCVFCGTLQDCTNSPKLHSAASKVLEQAAELLKAGNAERCLSLLHSTAGQSAFIPLHFYNRSHLDRLLLASSASTAIRDWQTAVQSASRALHMLHAICPAPSVQSAALHGSQASALLMLWRQAKQGSPLSTPSKADVRATLRLAIHEMDRSCGTQYPLYARLRRALDSLDK